MTLAAFQQALCELIRSPDVCLDVRDGDAGFLGRYDLSPRERARLEDIVWQRGMSTNCTLYRMNRVTPIYTLLHYTCLVLGDGLKATLEDYWAASELRDLEFKHEIHRFARFMRERLQTSASADPFVEEVLEFELAVNELRFAPRRDILARLRMQAAAEGETGPCLHPLVRVTRFRHEPTELLAALAQGRVPRELPEGECFLLLSVVDEDLDARTLDLRLGRALWDVQAGSCAQPDGVLDELAAGGLVLRHASLRVSEAAAG